MHEIVRNPQLNQVELMTLYSQEIREYPSLPDRKTLLLRCRLIFEEAMETIKAAGCCLMLNPDVGQDLVVEIDPDVEPDLVAFVDGLGDVEVVTVGAASSVGVDLEPVRQEIQRSNLSKRWAHCSRCDLELTHDGGGRFRHEPDYHHTSWEIIWKLHKREDGKVIKPPYYQAADVAAVINKQVDSYLQNLPHAEATAA